MRCDGIIPHVSYKILDFYRSKWQCIKEKGRNTASNIPTGKDRQKIKKQNLDTRKKVYNNRTTRDAHCL